MQVPKPVGDEVHAIECDPLIQLHLLRGTIDVDDDSHLKHNVNLNVKGPYLARQLSYYLALVMPSNVIAQMDPDGSTRDTRIYTSLRHGGMLNPTPVVRLLFLYSYAQLQGLLLLAMR